MPGKLSQNFLYYRQIQVALYIKNKRIKKKKKKEEEEKKKKEKKKKKEEEKRKKTYHSMNNASLVFKTKFPLSLYLISVMILSNICLVKVLLLVFC